MGLIANTVVGPANVSATEVIVANSKTTVALVTGNVFRITLDGSLGGPNYALNLRAGPAGSLSDNVVYSSNNAASNAQLIAALNNTWNASPGLSPVVLAQQAAAAAAAGAPASPSKVAGELLLVVTGNATSNSQVTLINPAPADGGLLSALGQGVLFSGNVNAGNSGVFITVGVKAATSNVYAYVGSALPNATGNVIGLSANAIYGATPPFANGIFYAVPAGNTWNLAASTVPVTNGVFQLGVIEQLS